ncbi:MULTISPECIES: hypothetical protein [Sphingobacterium]|nr:MULTISPECIES: hypothetical protein [Sphingobacterium]MCW2263483.1 hypothetical protein [Sphingobacterium kitahiroshimense]TCR05917.1 hypothetical protein EDF67_10953 [Sphingobacterium sp. JUb78]
MTISNKELEKAKSKEVNVSSLFVHPSGDDMLQIAQLMEKGILKSKV